MFKTLNQMLMKKATIAASAAIILAAGAATCWTVFGGNEDEFFCENLEALLDSEIVVQPICAWSKDQWCIYLEPYTEVEGVFVSDTWIKYD